MTADVVTMDKIVSLCKRRGFVFQSSEIYGGISSSYDYGYGLFSQRCDGAIVVDAYDYMSGLITTNYDFPFAITAAGQITQ